MLLVNTEESGRAKLRACMCDVARTRRTAADEHRHGLHSTVQSALFKRGGTRLRRGRWPLCGAYNVHRINCDQERRIIFGTNRKVGGSAFGL